MKFFRWLLSNIILIIIVIGLIYTYVYWGNLMGPGTPASKAVSYLSDEFVDVREFTNAIKVKNHQKDHLSDEKMSKSSQNIQHKSIQSKPVIETASKQGSANNHVMSSAPATEELAENSVNNSKKTVLSKQKNRPQVATEQSAVSHSEANYYSASKEIPQQGLAQQPATISYSHNHQQMQQSSNEQVLSTNNTIAENTMALSGRNTSDQSSPQGAVGKGQTIQAKNNTSGIKKETFVSPEIEKELKNAGAEDDVAALTPSAIRTVWIGARKSFYRRDYALSEKRYKRVIAATKNNFDAYGELGNVYFNQGKNDEAADAYMKAAVILVKQGQINRARSLLGLMQYLDKAKAQQLERKIDAAQ